MERSYFFSSVNHDRIYKPDDLSSFFALFFGNGVFPNPSTNLQVTADGSGMTVTLQPGAAFLNGHIYICDTALPLPLAVADGATNRIDRIVIRLDTAGRIISAQVKAGTFAASPAAPAIEQDANYFEIAVADVYVAAGAAAVSQANVTDQRLNTALCGIVTGTLEQVDTTTLYNQIQSALSTFQSQYIASFNSWSTAQQAAFTAWLQTVQNALSGDAAGNLLNLINGLAGSGRTTETVKGNADAITAHKADETLHTPYAVATNSGNAYSVTISPEPTAYADGLALCVKINAASTGAATLNVNGLGAVPVYDALGNAVTNFKENTPYSFRYESSAGRFIVLGKGGGGTAQPADVASGKTFTNDSGQQTGTSTKVYGPGDSLVDDQIFLTQAAGATKWNNTTGTPYSNFDSCFDGTYIYLAVYNNNSSVIYKYAQNGTLVKSASISYVQKICADSSNGHLYAIGGSSSAGSYSLFHFDDSLTLLKSVSLPNATEITVDANYIYVFISSNNTIQAIKKDLSSLTPIWTRTSTTLYPGNNDAFMAFGGYLYVATNSNGIYKINTADGSTIWNNTTYFYGATGSESVFVNDQNVCVAAYSSAGILNQADGSLKWKVSSGSARHVCADSNFMYLADGTGILYKFAKSDGTQWWTSSTLSSIVPQRIFVDTLYLYAMGSLALYAIYKTNQYAIKE